MANFLNGNAIYNHYSHFKNACQQWSTDISYNCFVGFGNDLIGMVEVLAQRHWFAQDIFTVSHHNQQGLY